MISENVSCLSGVCFCDENFQFCQNLELLCCVRENALHCDRLGVAVISL